MLESESDPLSDHSAHDQKYLPTTTGCRSLERASSEVEVIAYWRGWDRSDRAFNWYRVGIGDIQDSQSKREISTDWMDC